MLMSYHQKFWTSNKFFDLSSPTRDGTCALSSERVESWSLARRETAWPSYCGTGGPPFHRLYKLGEAVNGWGDHHVPGVETSPLCSFLFAEGTCGGLCPLETHGQPEAPTRLAPNATFPDDFPLISVSVSTWTSLALWLLERPPALITTSLLMDSSALWIWWGWAFQVTTASCCKAELFYAIPALGET